MVTLRALVIACTMVSAAWPATFGKVVPIRGHVADLALDTRRGLLYIANFTANRIEVMSVTDHQLQPPIFVPAQPGSIALSPDNRYLVIGHYTDWGANGTRQPGITILDLDGQRRQAVTLANAVLAVTFGNGAAALVVTTKDLELLEPATGTLRVLSGIGQLTAEQLPVSYPKFPPEIIQASTGVSGDGEMVYVLAQRADSSAVIQYRPSSQSLRALGLQTEPKLGPRTVSVNRDGSVFLAGWALTNPALIDLAQFPYATGALNVGSHAFDWSRNRIYAQIPSSAAVRSAAPPSTISAPEPIRRQPPVLHVVDTDNLTVRERIQLPENLAGRSVFSEDMQVLYGVSDSGVTILPIGSLDRAPRVVAVQEDLLFRGNGCDRRAILRELDVVDLSGGQTAFAISGGRPGVRIFPTSGTTPAKVQVEVDPNAFQNEKGTIEVALEIQSAAAVNLPMPVRLLINGREPEQRGAIFNVPGKLVDMLADPVRDRFYVIRQDRNLVLVFNGSTLELQATLRTGNTPTQMAVTRDSRYLIVGNDNSQLANVYDLETLTPVSPILFPGGHYPRSIAVSNRAILASVRSVASAEHKIDRVDFERRTAAELPSLGIYKNSVDISTVLTASPSGQSILTAMPDGNLLLYAAEADTFVAARKDFTAASGAVAALSDELYVIENTLLNSSLVSTANLEPGGPMSSGFAFVDGLGLRTSSVGPSSPGIIQRFDRSTVEIMRPTGMIESPITVNSLKTPIIGQIGQTILPFLRTLAPLVNRSSIVSLTISGLSVLPWNFDAPVEAPLLELVTNMADDSQAVAPGGLIRVRGTNLSPVTVTNSEVPLPTTLGEACLTVNGVLLPMLSASPDRVEAQLPLNVVGSARMVLRAPGGTSNALNFNIDAGAPAVFRNTPPGRDAALPTLFRARNFERVTLANPIHPEDIIIIFLTGLGRTSPDVEPGDRAPSNPLALTTARPAVGLGNAPLEVLYSGLVPGEIGVYQIDAKVPWWVSTGMDVPLTISQGGNTTTMSVRVVK